MVNTKAAGDFLIPVSARAHLAHAVLQVLAEDHGIDILHVKGAAVSPVLGRPRMSSADADVLVRPDQVHRYIGVLMDHGWQQVTSFATGSAFHHAANFYHRSWGNIDLHREFPGMTAPDAFSLLWEDRLTQDIAGVSCAVPSLTAQRLILILHLARNGQGRLDPDYARAWEGASHAEKDRIRSLVHRLGADMGFAAAQGDLDRYRDDPAHDLWEVFSTGNTSRLAEWAGRYKAAHGLLGRFRVVSQALLVNTDHLALKLSRPPRRREVVAEFFSRLGVAVRELRNRGLR